MEAGLRIFSRPMLARLAKAIGQCAVDRKSNEIKAIPDLLEMLAIKGTIVSIDAIGTETSDCREDCGARSRLRSGA
jgi:hypothetical protein